MSHPLFTMRDGLN